MANFCTGHPASDDCTIVQVMFSGPAAASSPTRAVGDCKTVNTKSIQSAIYKCVENENDGTLFVPKGTFLSSTYS